MKSPKNFLKVSKNTKLWTKKNPKSQIPNADVLIKCFMINLCFEALNFLKFCSIVVGSFQNLNGRYQKNKDVCTYVGLINDQSWFLY